MKKKIVEIFCLLLVCSLFWGILALLSMPHMQKMDVETHEDTTQTTTTTTTATTTTVTEPERAHYYLTTKERDTVERVVMAEAGGESFLGQMAVAQCILNACYANGIHPSRVVIDYAYTKSRPDPTEQVKEAVSAVFDDGRMAVAEDIVYFYAPERVSGDGHERRHEYVCTIGGHKFFK